MGPGPGKSPKGSGDTKSLIPDKGLVLLLW
jgi:hypothetical protein